MPSEREDLRQRVNELEATVRGLTQELVEATERIRTLEEGEDPSADKPMPEKGEESNEETENATEEPDEEEDDIIVA